MVKLPSLDKHSEQPQIGNRNFDAGITFSGGYSFKAFNLDHFVNLDAGYNHRFATPHDQLKFTATAGFSISKKTKILTQFFSTLRLINPNQPAFTQSSADDYDLSRLQISGLYKIDDTISLQVGGFSNIAGQNIGSGAGSLISVSKDF
jgi:protein XagA